MTLLQYIAQYKSERGPNTQEIGILLCILNVLGNGRHAHARALHTARVQRCHEMVEMTLTGAEK